MNLFNKNHITVTKTENEKGYRNIRKTRIAIYGEDSVFRIERKYFSTSSPRINVHNTRPKRTKGNIVLPSSYNLRKSEFGFYYSEPVDYEPIMHYGGCYEDIQKGVEWKFIFPDYTYRIRYLTKSLDKQIGLNVDVRPWQLADGSMEEHYIFDLLEEVTKICNRAKELKYGCYENTSRDYSSKDNILGYRRIFDAHQTKCDIFTDLFGYPDGPKFQTNEEKIFAHGFDLKTSFRKPKEK